MSKLKSASFYFWFLSWCLFVTSCSTLSKSQMPEATLPNPYNDHVATLSLENKLKMQRSIEDFYIGMRDPVMIPRILNEESSNPILPSLRTGENSVWFLKFFETLIGLQVMAKFNSFRGYQNSECYDAFVRASGMVPLPAASPLLSLDELMRAGNRIPDQNTYTSQVGLFCGRQGINMLQGIAPSKVAAIHLTLKNNLVLKKRLLKTASDEADMISLAYAQSLGSEN